MADNPYESSAVRSVSDDVRPRFSLLAIFLGVLADTVSGLLAGAVLGIGVVVYRMMQGENPQLIAEQMETSPVVVYGGLLIGCLGTLLGGYVAALMSKVWPLKHALLTGIGSILLGLSFGMAFGMDLTTISSLVWTVLAIPLALLGGYLYTLQRGPLPPDRGM